MLPLRGNHVGCELLSFRQAENWPRRFFRLPKQLLTGGRLRALPLSHKHFYIVCYAASSSRSRETSEYQDISRKSTRIRTQVRYDMKILNYIFRDGFGT